MTDWQRENWKLRGERYARTYQPRISAGRGEITDLRMRKAYLSGFLQGVHLAWAEYSPDGADGDFAPVAAAVMPPQLVQVVDWRGQPGPRHRAQDR